MNPYTTLWTGVTPGDGPQEFHLVLLDNGRSRVLADPVGRQALHCIRCSACLNVCPVYERVGGHAYHAPYPGPIGSILMPQLLGPGVHDSLPFASTLCGACADVCPVKIDIPRVLLHLRGRAVEGVGGVGLLRGRGGSFRTWGGSFQERWLMRGLGWLFRHPRMYRWSLAMARFLQRRGAAGLGPASSGGGKLGPFDGAEGMATSEPWIRRLPGYAAGWTLGRDVPPLPALSFREWWDLDRSG
jgi:L-lactate dehydrogenase complex protein LldF